MELEGLKRSLAVVQESSTITRRKITLITDRHSQVCKWLRENTNVTLYFDIWHIAIGTLLVAYPKFQDFTSVRTGFFERVYL